MICFIIIVIVITTTTTNNNNNSIQFKIVKKGEIFYK